MKHLDINILDNNKNSTLFYQATECMIDALLPNNKSSLFIDIIFDKDLAAEGFCTQIEEKIFTIEINNKISLLDQIKTLAHELVHCKQYLKKELISRNKYVYWKGVIQDPLTITTRNQDCSYETYVQCPWEKEAFEKEEILVEYFFKQYPNYRL